MTRQTATQTQQQASTTSPLSKGGILQRKCESCGQHTIAGGECAECAKNKSGLQRKLAIGASNDPLEQEADRVADQMMAAPAHSVVGIAPPRIQRFAGQAIRQADMAPASVDRVLASSGSPLKPALRQEVEQRFGHDFSRVRVHTGGAAEQSARDVNAHAYTVGHNIVFGAGTYRPETSQGRRLLAHELAHVVQQSGATHTSLVQRDLKAYNTAQTESKFSGDFSGILASMSAEAPGLRAALADLIAADKVKEVQSSDGSVSWFAAQHHRNVHLDDIRTTLQAAGYAKANPLARAIYDIHGEFLYSNQSLTTIAAFYSHTTQLGDKIEGVHKRSMTDWEIRQAHRVFGNAIDYSKVTIADGSVSARLASAGGYARTIGNVINFPTGGSRDMSLMVHELTHVWQYQTTGWSYAPKAIWAQVTEGYSYTDSGKTAEQSLKDARAAGKTLGSYNKEQQGDILSDYYRRLQRTQDILAWQPFINDINSSIAAPRDTTRSTLLPASPAPAPGVTPPSPPPPQSTRTIESPKKLDFYHGTRWSIAKKIPKNVKPLGGGDFATGFYTHHDSDNAKALKRAVAWGRRLANQPPSEPYAGIIRFGVPNVEYLKLFADNKAKVFDLKNLDQPNFKEQQKAWLDFITSTGRMAEPVFKEKRGQWVHERREPQPNLPYNIVAGPFYTPLKGTKESKPQAEEFKPFAEGKQLPQQVTWANEGIKLLNSDKVETQLMQFDAKTGKRQEPPVDTLSPAGELGSKQLIKATEEAQFAMGE